MVFVANVGSWLVLHNHWPTMSMITATAWVPRGFAKEFPTKYNLDEGEFSRISKLAQLELDEAKEDLEDARKNGADSTDGSDASDEVEDGAENAPCDSSTLGCWHA